MSSLSSSKLTRKHLPSVTLPSAPSLLRRSGGGNSLDGTKNAARLMLPEEKKKISNFSPLTSIFFVMEKISISLWNQRQDKLFQPERTKKKAFIYYASDSHHSLGVYTRPRCAHMFTNGVGCKQRLQMEVCAVLFVTVS